MRSAVYPERSRRGFTLVELLVVITIISLMAMIGMTSFKDFSEKQITIKAQGQVQTLLRLAQSNASTSTLCNGVGATSWALRFMDDKKTIKLVCEPSTPLFEKIYTLENAEISEIKCGGTSANTFIYSSGAAVLTFSLANQNPINASSCDITIKNLRNPTLFKKLTISKGGTINVE